MKEVRRSPVLKSGRAVTPRGGRTVLKSSDLQSKFPGQSCVSTTSHCSRILFPGLPIKGSRHRRRAGRIEQKVLGGGRVGSAKKGKARGKAFCGRSLCASLGHTVHSKEQEHRGIGRAQISRLPFARLYSHVLGGTLLPYHPSSKMETS